MSKKVAVIGGGFSGIAAAAYCAQAGFEVHVFEKNGTLGGRARQFRAKGYKFDMGPSWYWMPDIIERFFNDFGCSVKDFYELKALDPQFEMVFDDGPLQVPSDYSELLAMAESIETGAAKKMETFMHEAKFKYDVAMKDYIFKPAHSWTEFVSWTILKSAFKMQLLTSFKKHVRRYFSSKKLLALMEFPILFLGAMPEKIPAMYSLMNYGGYKLGTWYPIGGFGRVVRSMVNVARVQGVQFHCGSAVTKINVSFGEAVSIEVNGQDMEFDAIIGSADYHHIERNLLSEKYRNYNEAYWKSRTFAPSCLIFYIGLSRKIENLHHHTLFFENDLELHANEIYNDKKWPTKPLFYVCCPSKTDATVAPENHENLFLLMPLATGIDDDPQQREKYFSQMLERLEKHTESAGLSEYIDYKSSYCINDFMADYNAYGGNAYGLANTLKQTAMLKPAIRNKQVKNLFYAGQLTVPGPGVPPSLISGKIVANEVINLLKK
ncbi:MAG TPA: phytoene desaturase family protein [Flavobacterium sp.]|jgi:phytoene desaturase